MRSAARRSRQGLSPRIDQQQHQPAIRPAAGRFQRQRDDEPANHPEVGGLYIPAFTWAIAWAMNSSILVRTSSSLIESPLAARSLVTLRITSRSRASANSATTTSLE